VSGSTCPQTDGVDVDLAAGQVTVPGSLPNPPRLLDFLMVATAGDGVDDLRA
jgi:hypothetical protein